MLNSSSTYKTDEDKLRAHFTKLYEEIAILYDKKLTPEFVDESFKSAKEDIDNNKFTWKDLGKAMRDSKRTSERFPTYSVFYKQIMDKKTKESNSRRASDVEEQWRAFKSYPWGSFVIRDDIMYTIGIKYGLHEELRRSDKYTIGAIKKRFDDLLGKINRRQITPSQDPRFGIENLFYDHSPYKYIPHNGKDKLIYYEDKREDDRIFSFDDPRWN